MCYTLVEVLRSQFHLLFGDFYLIPCSVAALAEAEPAIVSFCALPLQLLSQSSQIAQHRTTHLGSSMGMLQSSSLQYDRLSRIHVQGTSWDIWLLSALSLSSNSATNINV